MICNANLPDRPKIFHNQLRLCHMEKSPRKTKRKTKTLLVYAFPLHLGQRLRLSIRFTHAKGIFNRILVNNHIYIYIYVENIKYGVVSILIGFYCKFSTDSGDCRYQAENVMNETIENFTR